MMTLPEVGERLTEKKLSAVQAITGLGVTVVTLIALLGTPVLSLRDSSWRTEEKNRNLESRIDKLEDEVRRQERETRESMTRMNNTMQDMAKDLARASEKITGVHDWLKGNQK